MVLHPIDVHMHRQNTIAPFTNPIGNLGWPEVEAQLRWVHEFTSLTAIGGANNLAIDLPDHLVGGPFHYKRVVGVGKGFIVWMHLLGTGDIAQSGDDIALPRHGVVFAEHLDVHFLPEDFSHFRAVLPKEKVRDDSATFRGAHADNVFSVHLLVKSEYLGGLVGLRKRDVGNAEQGTQQKGALH